MATVETTPSVTNYLGHACHLAPAFDRFKESLEASRKDHDDTRNLAQRLGEQLAAIVDRCEHEHDVTELAQERAEEHGEDLHLKSLLAMQVEHSQRTCNDVWDLVGMVLDMLDRADMVKPSQAAEVPHG